MLHKESVVISGYAVSVAGENKSQPAWYSAVESLPRKYQRFGGRSAAEAVAACRDALNMAEINPETMGERFGLYTSQAGFQHSDLDDYSQAFASISNNETLYDELWNSKMIDPFQAIRGLSNNLMGLISGLWSMRGDCSAFVRDEAGAASALHEAHFNLKSGLIDAALVVMSGTTTDCIEMAMTKADMKQTGSGAVALVLQRKNGNSPLGAPCELNAVNVRYAFPVEVEGESTNSPRWGGVLFDIAHLLAEDALTCPEGALSLCHQDCYGHQITATLTRR